jgi:HAD superfamily hydrolase (TIGR01549 family)
MQTKIQSICFDVDGTLNDTDDLLVEKIMARLQLLPGLGEELSTKLSRKIVMGLDDPINFLIYLMDTFHLDELMVQILEVSRKHARPYRKEFRPVPGIIETLKQLHNQVPLAIVSARDEASTVEFLDHHDLLKYFQFVAGTQTALHTKPYPDPILLACHKMGVSPECNLMIGDTAVDIKAGLSAGSITAGVLCGFGDEKELRRAGAHHILTSTVDVLTLF